MHIKYTYLKAATDVSAEKATIRTEHYLLALADGVAANGRLGFGVTVHGLLILVGGFNPDGFGSPVELMLSALSFPFGVFRKYNR